MWKGDFQTPNSHMDGEDSAETMVYNTKSNPKKKIRKKGRSKKHNSNKKEL